MQVVWRLRGVGKHKDKKRKGPRTTKGQSTESSEREKRLRASSAQAKEDRELNETRIT